MFRAPVASVSLLVFSQFTSSERSCSAAFVRTVVSIFNGPSCRNSLCAIASSSLRKPSAACEARYGTCWMSSAAAWLSAPATAAKKTSRPTVAASDEGKCRRRRIQETSGSRSTVTVSAIATGMMTIVRRAMPHRTAMTRPATTRVRHEIAAAMRRVRGTAAATSRSSSCSSRTDTMTGAGADSSTRFVGRAAESLPMRSDSFHRGCS